MLLSASGTFSADSGRSIFLEQHVEQRGTRKYFRWEIPYPYIYRVEAEAKMTTRSDAKLGEAQLDSAPRAAAAGAGESSRGAPSVLPLPQRPKTS